MKKNILLAAVAAATFRLLATDVLVECESFSDKGGWCVDAQFVCSMGSPYLLAHGMGVPVADAVTTNVFPSIGEWRVWVRTRDWTPDYDGPKPGRFQLALNGETLPVELGVMPEDWGWVDAGLFTNTQSSVELRLHDLTGFDGRCDAIYFSDDISAAAPPTGATELAAWRAAQKGENTVPSVTENYDFVVVGGGIAGTCAALAAAEKGLQVVLIQDRPVLGGNASSEIRVQSQGDKRHRIVEAVANDASNMSANSVTYDARRMAEVAKYPNIDLFIGWRAFNVEMSSTGTIAAVYARNVESGERVRFAGEFFADCTGDGWLAFWGGAEFSMGREAHAVYGEPRAPEIADGMTMGSSLMWTTTDTGAPVSFPEVPWALTVAGTRASIRGDWYWEYGLFLDTVYDAEEIRDHLLRAIYGNFYNAKLDSVNENRAFSWVPYVAGKRESRRIVGDYILTQQDIEEGRWFEDAVGTADWSIDLHFPQQNVSYLSYCIQGDVGKWFFPYRCLYSRDIPNLFMAGRNISVSHVGLGSPRVLNTCGQMGVAIGYAAWLCDKYSCTPRDIYRSEAKTEELQLTIGGTWPERVYVEPEEPGIDVIVDNSDSENVDFSGTWTASTSETGQFYGENYLHDGNTGKGSNKWFRFTPDLPQAGLYKVYAIWSASPGRATSVPIDIVSQEGTNTVFVNMQENGGVWNQLGEFSFNAGSDGSVKIGTFGTSSYVIADAVRFVIDRSLVVDNSDADVSGTWISSTSAIGEFYGENYLHNDRVASSDLWVNYVPGIPSARTYRLRQMWNSSSSRATAVKVEVTHADGVTTNTVNMQEGSGVWNTIGVYRFDAGTGGGARLLTEGCSGYHVIADAFRWDDRGDVIVDNADGLPSVEISGSWVESESNPDRFGSDYLHNNHVADDDTWVKYTPMISSNRQYTVWMFWNDDASRDSAVPVEIVHVGGTNVVCVDMTDNGGKWNDLGTYTFAEGSSGSVRICSTNTTGYIIADAVWFDPVTSAFDLSDWDGNGLTDSWERWYFLNAGGVDPDADPDGDGLTNMGEFIAGCDPTDENSYFSIKNMLCGDMPEESGSSVLELKWPSADGRTYTVKWSESVSGPYDVLESGISATPPMNTYQVESSLPRGFFKVIVEK